jgi:hypothetical protein
MTTISLHLKEATLIILHHLTSGITINTIAMIEDSRNLKFFRNLHLTTIPLTNTVPLLLTTIVTVALKKTLPLQPSLAAQRHKYTIRATTTKMLLQESSSALPLKKWMITGLSTNLFIIKDQKVRSLILLQTS